MRDRWLTVFFALAFAVCVGYTLAGLASIPGYYQRVTTQTVAPYVVGGVVQFSNEMVAQKAAERALTLRQYAVYEIVSNSLMALIPLGVAAVLVWRARGQWFAWYTAFIMVFLGEYALADQTYAAQLLRNEWYSAISIFWVLLLPYFYFFPNGNPVPRRALWLVGPLVFYHFLVQVWTVALSIAPEKVAALGVPDWGRVESLAVLPVLLSFVVTFACQVYRYTRVSTPTERQQTKWFLFGFGLLVVTLPVSYLTRGHGGFVDDLVGEALFFLVLPLSIAVGALRYRLWDIDLIIRRTLVYGALTAALGLIYFGLIVFLQGLLSTISNQQSPVIVVISTLAIYALFTPLRRRIQRDIDRRFYRKKYNAARVLAEFGAHARDEVELDKLTARLVAVVEETMQPERVTLWLARGDTRPHREGSV